MRAELFDAGSIMIIDQSRSKPGMDRGYYRAINMEYDFKTSVERRVQINREIWETATTGTLRPWPVPFPWRCWIDITDRYSGEDSQFGILTHRHDNITGDFDQVPEGLSWIEIGSNYDPAAKELSQRMNDAPSQDDIAARTPAPTEWLHLPVLNRGAYADLKEPAILVQGNHLDGSAFRVSVEQNPLFAPFDLTKPERYRVLNSDGETLSAEFEPAAMTMRKDAHYKLYLRPANWRWVGHVYATYIYVSWFEMFYTTLQFTRAWFDRPPIYPYRHDLIHTTQYPWWEYMGTYWSTDAGIDYAFDHSNGAAELRREIIDQQWWTQSEAFIFYRNDPATCVLWNYPPEERDIVCGIARVDNITGEEQTIWIQQKSDLTSEYPWEVIGSYIIPSFIVAM